MGLITSVAEAEAMRQTGSSAGSRTTASSASFQNVLKGSMSGISESMDVIFEEAAAKYNLSSNLLRAVAKAESNFNPSAVSKAGAQGVMQLMPATARSLGVTDSFDARQNIMGGAKYLKENLERFNGNVSYALAAYNAGPNAVQKYGGIPPYKETQNYVKKIMSSLGGTGTSLYANKQVTTGGQGYSSYLDTNLVMAMGGSSSGSLGGLGSLSSLGSFSGFGGGNSLSSLYSLSSLTDGMELSEDGDTVTMDKQSFANLIQILRIQMMMNASREVGTITI